MTVSSRGMMVASVQYDPEGETRNERLWRELETLVPDTIHDDVEVDASNVIGKAGDGMSRALRQIGDTRLAIAADAVGRMRYVLALLTTHLLTPHRAGDRLGDREGVRLRYADLRIKAFAARSMVYRAARLAAVRIGPDRAHDVGRCLA